MAEKNSILYNSIKSSEKESQINFSEISDDTQCVINIELSKGHTKSLKINFDSDPNELAYLFCHENNLNFNSLNSLANKIKTIKETILSNSKDLRVSSIKFNKSLICDSQTNKNDNFKLSKKNSLKSDIPINNGLNNNFNTIEHSNKNTLNFTQERQNSTLNSINNSNSNRNSIPNSNTKLYKNNTNTSKKNNEKAKTTLVINQTIQKCMNIIEKEERPSKATSNFLESGNISIINNITNTNNNINNDATLNLNLTNINNNNLNNNTINNINTYTSQKKQNNPSIENGFEFNFNYVDSSYNDEKGKINRVKRFVKFVDGVNNRINARINNNVEEDNGAKNNSDIQYDKILTDYEDQINEKEINISKIDDNSLNNHAKKNSINNSDIFGDCIDATYSNNYSNNINYNLTNTYTFNNNNNKNENFKKNDDLNYSIKKEVNIRILPSIDNINLKKQSISNSMNQCKLNPCYDNNINLFISKIENTAKKNLNNEFNTINVASVEQRNNILKRKNMEINYIDINKNNNNNYDNIKVVDENNNNNEQINVKRAINFSKESIHPFKNTILSSIKNTNAKTLFNSFNFSIDEKESNNNYLSKPSKTSKKNNSNYSNCLKDYITESGNNLTKNSTRQNILQNSTINTNLNDFYYRIPNSQRYYMPNKLTLSQKKSVQFCLRNIYNGCGAVETKSIDIDASSMNRYGTENKSFGTKKKLNRCKNIMNFNNKNANSICSSVFHDKNIFSTERDRFESNKNNNFYKRKKFNNFSSNKKLQKNNKSCSMNNSSNRNEIIKALNNVFCFINKDRNYFDVFSNLNRKNIPSEFFEPVHFIIKNCNQKQRFISINEFSTKGAELFDKLNLKDQILILNFLN